MNQKHYPILLLAIFASITASLGQLVPNAPLKGNKYKSDLFSVNVKPANSGSYTSSYVLTHHKGQFTHDGNNSQVSHWADDHFTTFSSNENAKVQIILASGNITSFEARPSTNISGANISNGRLEFTIHSDKYVTLIINGMEKQPLHIFHDPAETAIPSKTCNDVYLVQDGSTSVNNPLTLADVGNATTIYFEEGGIHYIGVGFKITNDNNGNRLNDNNIKEIYIPNGTLVVGSIRAVRVNDMKIHGRGVICGQEGYSYRKDGNYTTDRIYNSAICMVDYGGSQLKNQTIEGITSMWALKYHLLTASGATVQNVKCFDFHETTDGVGTGRNSVVRNSFFKVNDDVVKLYDDNIYCENLYVWHQTNGAVYQFGWGDAEGQNCTVNNTYLLHDDSYYSKGNGWWSNHSIINWMHSNNANRLHKDHIIDGINAQGMPNVPVFKLVGINLDCSEGCASSGSVGGDLENLVIKNVKIGAEKTTSYAGTNKNGSDISISLCNVKSNGSNLTIEERESNGGNVQISTSNNGCGTPGTSSGFTAWIGGSGGGCESSDNDSDAPVDPVISFVTPQQDQTISGTYEVQTLAYDEDFGTNHGDGIVDIYYQIFTADDPTTAIFATTVSQAPFHWSLNTNNFPNGDYELRAGVKSQDFTTGRKWTVVKPITINNTTQDSEFTNTFTYPTGSGQAFASDKYDVFVKVGNEPEQELQVLMSDVNYRTMYDGDWMKNENKDRSFSFAQLDYDKAGPGLTFRVVKKFGNNSQQAVISPKSYGLTANFSQANEFTFTIDDNAKYISINFDDGANETPNRNWIRHMLTIFIDPMESGKPLKNGNGVVTYGNNVSASALQNASVIYFPTGYHNLRNYNNGGLIDNDGVITLKTNQSIYLEGGAFLEGIVQRSNYNDQNQRVFGRGILTGRQYYWKNHPNHSGPLYGELIQLGKNSEVKGIMYMESPNHGYVAPNGHVENVKFLGWHSNHDGIRVGSGSEIEHSFLRAVDDHFYNFDIHVHDCVIWAGHNGAILTYGWGGEQGSNNYNAGSSLMEDIDIINPEWTNLGNNNGLIMSQVGFNHPIHDYNTGDATTVLRNIRVEGSIPGITNLKPRSNGSGNIAVQVHTDDVTFVGDLILENISVEHVFQKGLIRGDADPDYNGNKKWLVKDVLLKNITIGGECVTDDNKHDYFNIDANTIQNVVFECENDIDEVTNITDLTLDAPHCTSVTLNWSDVTGEEAYRVRRRLPGGTYEILEDLPADAETYTDYSVEENTTYEYMVRPMQGGVAVKISNVPSIDVPECLVTSSLSHAHTSLRAHPNPFNEELHFELGGLRPTLIEVITTQGKVIYEQVPSPGETHNLLPLPIPRGTYILKVTTDQGSFVEMVVKQ